jgi:hypothetical protein
MAKPSEDKELTDIAKYINGNGIKTVNSRLNDEKRVVVFKGVNFKNTVNRNRERILKMAKTYRFDDTILPQSIANFLLKNNIMKRYEPLYEQKDPNVKVIPEFLKESKENSQVLLILGV